MDRPHFGDLCFVLHAPNFIAIDMHERCTMCNHRIIVHQLRFGTVYLLCARSLFHCACHSCHLHTITIATLRYYYSQLYWTVQVGNEPLLCGAVRCGAVCVPRHALNQSRRLAHRFQIPMYASLFVRHIYKHKHIVHGLVVDSFKLFLLFYIAGRK